MFNDKMVYTEHALMRDQLRKDYKLAQKLDNIHRVIAGLGCDSICQVDCKFGLDLIKIKRESWKSQMSGIADHFLYERYSRNLFRHQDLIDFNFSEIKNINGQDLYDLVFVNNKKVNSYLLRTLINLTKKYVVIPMDSVEFKLCEHDTNYEVINNILVYQKPQSTASQQPSKVEAEHAS